MIMGQLTESNLFGRGQQVQLRGTLGGKATRYTLSFTEPWLFDRPISFGVDLYDWEARVHPVQQDRHGRAPALGFPHSLGLHPLLPVLQV